MPENAHNTLSLCLPGLTPRFNEKVWLDTVICAKTNCYTYSLDCPEMGRQRPGHLKLPVSTADGYKKLNTVDNIRKFLLEQDGLIEISEKDALSGKFHAIALRVQKEKDCHFFRRLLGSEFWSHKVSTDIPSALDDENRPIINPAKIPSYGYREFGGFFTIPENGVLYVPRLAVPEKFYIR